MELDALLEDLNSAEAFLEAFEVQYDAEFLKHKRVQLLRLFRKNLEWFDVPHSRDDYQTALTKAYCLLQRGESMALNASKCGQCNDCH
ncbi:nitrogenase-stabilizing/protective protein NifW [Echinimonas agarilytica]|uniref:Nitrogenase-stabilizing/protective protein NifW n=1 Tax=Echinimonas agarilytica TaxID=1215918 RepID=A0AA42B835_9GAMM|nr:nitrogenase-stabilizing/protective protein NifW [Echinimonas agarilytica]MCM2680439.1 nitrogenase-stabilizing/protective protein NifW [Echinimonas agarilytica]